MRHFFLALILCLMSPFVWAQTEEAPLPLEQAFTFTTHVDEHNNLTFQWNIAPGYYLYQNKMQFTISPTSNLKIGQIAWPKNTGERDFEGQMYPTYSGMLKLTVPLIGPFRGPLTLVISYQGCSLGGFCYAPVKKYLHVNLDQIKPLQDLTRSVSATSTPTPFLSDQDMAQSIFAGHNTVWMMLSFLGLGLLLAFTPCVLPMVPILSGIIVGHQKKVSTWRAFTLSLAYVLGMAITYAVAGIVIATIGSSVQVALQKPWVMILLSGLFILLSLSLFGFYDLELPKAFQHHTTKMSNRLAGGTYFGVFVMGCISTLIVSPCVSAPLVGVLAYIAQTGDKLLGGMALLMLGIGMGIPLLVIGASAGRWLPKAGAWMDLVKKLFGFLMLGVAVWMLSRVLSGSITLFLWAFLSFGVGAFLSLFTLPVEKMRKYLRIGGTILLVYGVILIIGACMGNSDPLNPWEKWGRTSQQKNDLFTVVKDQRDLDQRLSEAKQNKKQVILDFYATWCVSCVLMDKHVFTETEVRKALSSFVLLRADVTVGNQFDQAIMKSYNVIAPPVMIFFDQEGHEISSRRIVGEMTAKNFLKNLNEVIKEGQSAK